MSERKHLRPVDEPRMVPLSDDEAISESRAAWLEARRSQLATFMHQQLTAMLCDTTAKVTYRRLKTMRALARDQVARAQRVEAELTDAMSAMEATRPRGDQ